MRDRIAEAENTLNITIEERLKDLRQAFVASDSTKWERKKEDILESISCRLLPKKIMDTKEEKNCSDGTKGVLISGVPAKQVKVDEIQYFIDMKIEGMILGVLWIMMIGWQLDNPIPIAMEIVYERRYIMNFLKNRPFPQRCLSRIFRIMRVGEIRH